MFSEFTVRRFLKIKTKYMESKAECQPVSRFHSWVIIQPIVFKLSPSSPPCSQGIILQGARPRLCTLEKHYRTWLRDGSCGSQAFSYTLAPSSSILIVAVTVVEVHTLICDAQTHLYVQFPKNHTLCCATGITHSLCRVVPGIKSATPQIKGSSSKDKSALHAWVWHWHCNQCLPK